MARSLFQHSTFNMAAFLHQGGGKPLSFLIFNKHDIDNNGWLSREEFKGTALALHPSSIPPRSRDRSRT